MCLNFLNISTTYEQWLNKVLRVACDIKRLLLPFMMKFIETKKFYIANFTETGEYFLAKKFKMTN